MERAVVGGDTVWSYEVDTVRLNQFPDLAVIGAELSPLIHSQSDAIFVVLNAVKILAGEFNLVIVWIIEYILFYWLHVIFFVLCNIMYEVVFISKGGRIVHMIELLFFLRTVFWSYRPFS